MGKVKGKWLLVLMESLAGSGHKFAARRLKAAPEKHERFAFDPSVRQWVVYRELKKIRTIR